MWPFPKVEMQWTAPRGFAGAMASCRNGGEHERLSRRIGIFFGCLLVTAQCWDIWIKKTISFESEDPVWLVLKLVSLPIWFAAGFLLVYAMNKFLSHMPSTYRIVGSRIDIIGGNRRFAFESIERAKLHEFGAFRVIELEVRDRGTVLLGAPADLDFKKLRCLFESRGIDFELSGMAYRWPEKKAVLQFEQLEASSRSSAKSLSKAKREDSERLPAAVVLLRSAIVISALIGIVIFLSQRSRNANDELDRERSRLDTMTVAASEAKNAAGADWPKVRQNFEGPLKTQADITTAAVNRTLNLAYVTGIISFVAFIVGFFVVLVTIQEWLD